MRKIFTFILALIVGAGTLFAASGTCGANLTWELNSSGVLTISGSGDMTDWVAGDAPWYSSRSSIKTVKIEYGVTSIGRYAFYNCNNISSVTIGSSVKSIKYYAFKNCYNLLSVIIPNSVTSIGNEAFHTCSSLASVSIGEGITSTGWGTGNAPVQRVEDAAQYPEFNDWGDKVIREGGLLGQRWRTLTWEEWYYLLVERPHADELRGQATVNNVHGYILLPDDWKQSNKIPFTPDPNNWTTNEYNDKQWKKMEEAGAVFLPAAGFRSDREVSTVGAFGFYWSSTVFVSDRVPQDDARDIFISEKRFGPRDHEKRYYGLSVRLVQDVF